jgi:GNAT superfamily N-acetyltransferase
MSEPDVCIETLTAAAVTDARQELIDLLRACVDAGGSLGFLAPIPHSQAAEFWSAVVPQVDLGARTVFVARDARRVIGTVQLAFESKPNARHRAEVMKMMVLPSYRRRGIAAQLMRALEQYAGQRGITLLVLDTAEGPSGARSFYQSLGYTYVGGIPDYALDPDGHPTQNAIYFKKLG